MALQAEDRKQFQTAFVRELGQNVLDRIINEIESGRIPESWDGIELRWLLADRFEDATLRFSRKDRRWREFQDVLARVLRF